MSRLFCRNRGSNRHGMTPKRMARLVGVMSVSLRSKRMPAPAGLAQRAKRSRDRCREPITKRDAGGEQKKIA